MALERFPITLTRFRRHGRACPGHPRLDCRPKDVDARDKPAHDGGETDLTLSGNALAGRLHPPEPLQFAGYRLVPG